MAHSLDYAKRLIARLHLPDDAEKILEIPSYWDETVCELYFESCEELIYHTPADALTAAAIAPRLAAAVPEDNSLEGRRKHNELLIRGHAILAGAYRAVGRHDDSEHAYRSAFQFNRPAMSSKLKAMLYRWMAYLRCAQNRFGEALDLANEAFDTGESENAKGGALAVRGYVQVRLGRCSKGVRDFSKALSMIDPRSEPKSKKRCQRVRYAAIHSAATDSV